MKILVNGTSHEVDVEHDTPLLWVLRDALGLTGTRFSCGVGACGACMVLLDGKPMRSCSYPVSAVGSAEVTTIEGFAAKGHPLLDAWIEHQVPQCGYCQSGQLLAASALLADNPHPSDEDIGRAMSNLCRCGTYNRIRTAIQAVAAGLPASPPAAPEASGTEPAAGPPTTPSGVTP